MMPRFFLLVIFSFLIVFSPENFAAGKALIEASGEACDSTLVGEKGVFDIEIRKKDPSQEQLIRRAIEVIKHQNEILAAKNLPQIISPIQPRNWVRHGFDNRVFSTSFMRAAKNGKVVDDFYQLLSVGDVIFRGTWGDVDGLNYAYTFSEDNLVRVETFAGFVLRNVEDQVVLARLMDARELKYWRRNYMGALSRNGRYGTIRHHQKAIHFHLGQGSWVGHAKNPILTRWRIPRDVLERWNDQGLLSVGTTHIRGEKSPHRMDLEIVVFEPAWQELASYLTYFEKQ